MSKYQNYDLVITSHNALIPDSIGIIVGNAKDDCTNSPDIKQGANTDYFVVDFGGDIGTCTVCSGDMMPYSIKIGGKGKVIVGRAINGISINGLEFLLDEEGEALEFRNVREATRLMFENGISPEGITEMTFSRAWKVKRIKEAA